MKAIIDNSVFARALLLVSLTFLIFALFVMRELQAPTLELGLVFLAIALFTAGYSLLLAHKTLEGMEARLADAEHSNATRSLELRSELATLLYVLERLQFALQRDFSKRDAIDRLKHAVRLVNKAQNGLIEHVNEENSLRAQETLQLRTKLQGLETTLQKRLDTILDRRTLTPDSNPLKATRPTPSRSTELKDPTPQHVATPDDPAIAQILDDLLDHMSEIRPQ